MPRVPIVLFVLSVGACAFPDAQGTDQRRQIPTARSCAAQGKVLDHFGMFGSPTCVTRYADAGKVCRSKSDCLGRCVVRLGTDETNGRDFSVGVETNGQCAKQDALDGCYSTVERGRVTESLCVD